MKKLLFIFLFLFFFISNEVFSSLLNDKINKLVCFDSTDKNQKIFFITNLELCLSCNINKINIFLRKIKNFNKEINVNFVIESKNKNDGLYLKNKLFFDYFYEDNEIFLTETTKAHIIIILKENNFIHYFKIFNPNDLSNKNFLQNFMNRGEFTTDFKITENDTSYLSKIEILKDKSLLKIFDYKNNNLYSFDSSGIGTKYGSFNNPYIFYIGNKENLDRVKNDGISFDVLIKKISFNNDTLFVFFDDVLYNIYIDNKGFNAIDLRSILCVLYENKIIKHCILKIGNYNNYYHFNGKHYLEVFTFPNELNKYTPLYSELDFENGNLIGNKFTCLNSLESTFNFQINDFKDIIYKEIDDNGNFIFMIKGKNLFNIMNLSDSSIKIKIDLKGIIDFNDEIVFRDCLLKNEKFYALLTDQNLVYFQVYNVIQNTLENEFIYNLVNDKVLESKILSTCDNKFELILRLEKARWTKNTFYFSK